MAFKAWTRQDLTSASAFSVYLAVIIVGLGIARLVFDGPQRDPLDRSEALLLGACFPALEIPVKTNLTLRPVPAPEEKSAGVTTKLPENPVSATGLTVVTTGAVTLDLPQEKLPKAGSSITLSGHPVVLKKSQGDFELRLEKDAALVKWAGADVLLQTLEEVRFGPADGVSYVMKSDAKADITEEGSVKKVVVPAGTTLGILPIGTGQALSTLQPVTVLTWLSDATATLMPVRVSGQPGLADVAIEVNQPGMNFAQGVAMRACASGDRKGGWLRAGVSQTTTGAQGSAKIMVALPAGVLPAAQQAFAPLHVAVASSDGRYAALGGFNAIGRSYAALGATALVGLLLGALMYFRGQQLTRNPDGTPRWFAGLFIGPDDEPSLSLLQVFVWTVITIWGFLYVFFVAGNLLTLTTEMMGLLGIAGAGTVLARWIGSSSGSTLPKAPATPASVGLPAAAPAAAVPAPAGPPPQSDFWRMLSTNGNFDLLKLQLFAFTVVIAMYVVWRIADSAAFPVLDANTLLLLGVSQGVYISGKLAASTPLSRAQSLKLEIESRSAAQQQLEEERARLEAERKKLEDDVAALSAGAAVPATIQANLDANKDVREKNAAQLKVTQEKVAALQLDYTKALADLGLTSV